MTIQKTALFCMAALMLATTANAQCVRARRVILDHGHYGHQVHRPHDVVPVYRDYATYRHAVHAVHPVSIAQIPVIPTRISFGSCSHVDDLAARLEILMNELCLDLHYNYSHNPGFSETYAEAYSLFQMAQSIHAAEHNFDRQAMRAQLAGADALFHHVQSDVQGWTRLPRRQIGTLGIQTKIELSEETLHHLMEDVGVVVTPGLEPPPVPNTVSVAPAPPLAPNVR